MQNESYDHSYAEETYDYDEEREKRSRGESSREREHNRNEGDRERYGQRNKSRDNSREIDHYRNDISNGKYLRFSHTLFTGQLLAIYRAADMKKKLPGIARVHCMYCERTAHQTFDFSVLQQ